MSPCDARAICFPQQTHCSIILPPFAYTSRNMSSTTSLSPRNRAFRNHCIQGTAIFSIGYRWPSSTFTPFCNRSGYHAPQVWHTTSSITPAYKDAWRRIRGLRLSSPMTCLHMHRSGSGNFRWALFAMYRTIHLVYIKILYT